MEVNWIQILVGILISTPLVIIGFFIKKLIDSIDLLSKTVQSMQTVTATLETSLDLFNSRSAEDHTIINNRLADHSKRIRNIEQNIEVLKSKME